MTTTIDIETLRWETVRALLALGREHDLPAFRDLSMCQFTHPTFTALTIQLPDGPDNRAGVAHWAKVLGLPAPEPVRYGDVDWHEAYQAKVNKREPVWLGWNIVEVTCTVARGGAK